MKRSTLASVSRRALQLATLFLAATPVTFGGEPVTSVGDGQLIGAMVVTATREHPVIGHMVVSATRFAPANALVADLGAMTVTAPRVMSFVDLGAMTVTAPRAMAFARNDAPMAEAAFPVGKLEAAREPLTTSASELHPFTSWLNVYTPRVRSPFSFLAIKFTR